MKFIVVTILNGEIWFISQCKTRKGAEISKRYSLNLIETAKAPKTFSGWRPGTDITVRILSMEDILKWDDSGIAELEAMIRL